MPRRSPSGCARSSPARPTTSPTSSSTLDDGFYGACARVLRALPRGEVVTYGELAALAGAPGAARAAGSFCARNRLSPVRALPPRRRGRTASAPSGRSGSTTSAACWRSRVSFSDELRDELASIAPRAALLPARRALGALPRRRRLAPARPRRARRPARPRERGGGAARLHAAARARRALRAAHLPPQGLRPRDPLPAPRRGRRRPRPRSSARRACSRRGARRSTRPPKRVVGRSCCRGAYLRGALLGGGSLSGPRVGAARAALGEPCEGAELLAAIAAREGVELRVAERDGHALAYAKLRRGDRRPARARRRGRRRAAPRRARRRRRDPLAGEPARERRRGEREAHRAGRPAPARGDPPLDLDALPEQAARDRAAAPAPSGALARRARGQVPAADQQGGRPPPHADAACAWPRTRAPAMRQSPRRADGAGGALGGAPPVAPCPTAAAPDGVWFRRLGARPRGLSISQSRGP